MGATARRAGAAASPRSRGCFAGSPSRRPAGLGAPAARGSLAVTGVAAIALSALLMLNDNAEARVIQDLRADRCRALARRAPAVRARAHGPPPRLAGHRAARGRRPGRRGRARAAARARHLRGARGRTAQAPPDLSWQAVALGAGAVEADALHELLAVPPPGAIPLSSGYLSLDLQPLRAGRRRAGPRRAPPGRLGARPGRRARGAARLVRARGGREPARPRRRRLLRRPARAGDRLPRPRRARRPGAGRGAHLPGRHRRGPRRRAARRPRPQRRRRRAPRPARRGASRAPGRAWSTASRSTPTPTAPCWRPTAAPPCSTPSPARARSCSRTTGRAT